MDERLNLIREIKKHASPPFKTDDIYFQRDPWPKLGGVSSGICMAWCWYRDGWILAKATQEDLERALAEFTE